jgi:DNA modification methylase
MLRLLRDQDYNHGKRPSEHKIGAESFLTDHGGAIPSNVLTFTNTISNDSYQQYCRVNELQPHPARMQAGLPEFFVKFLTTKGDLVMDPFAGSNTTGAVAEALGRRWLSIEADENYVEGSLGRFPVATNA